MKIYMQLLWLISTLRFYFFFNSGPPLIRRFCTLFEILNVYLQLNFKQSWQISLATTPQGPIDAHEKYSPGGRVQHMQPPPPFIKVYVSDIPVGFSGIGLETVACDASTAMLM